MSTFSCRELREAWELFQDGALRDVECQALAEHLAACPACSEWSSEDFLLAESLRRSGPESGARTWRTGIGRRLAVGVAAAAAMLIVGIVLGRILGGSGGAGPGLEAFDDGEVLVADAGEPLERRLGGGRARVLAGAEVSIEAGTPLVRRGTLAVEALARPTRIETPLGSLRITGSALIHVEPGDGAAGRIVTVLLLEGGGVFSDAHNEITLEAQVPVVVRPRGVTPLPELLARLEEILEDEALVVMTSEEALAYEGRYLAEIAELEQRLGELMAARSKLQLERDALRSRLGDDPRPLRGPELVAAAALRLMDVGSGDPSDSEPRSRHLLAMLEGSEDDILPAVARHLLGADASRSMKIFGLRLLARIDGEEARDMIQRFIADDEPAVRCAAIDALARHRSPSARPLLEKALAEDSDLACRVGAAGGLVALGDSGTALQFLMKTWRESDPAEAVIRGAVLGRILQAPVASIAPFLAEVASDPLVGRQDRRDLVDILGELGGPEAIAVLEFLLLATEDPEERAYINLTLSAMEG